MIVVLPALRAFTVPSASTVATVSSLEAYVSFAVDGQAFAASFVSDPTTTSVGALKLIPAFTTFAVAVSVFFTVFPDFFPVTLTVTFAVPFLTAVTLTVFPETLTVAAFLFKEEATTFTLFHVEGVVTLMFLACFLAVPAATVTDFVLSFAVVAASADATGTAVTTIAKARLAANAFLNDFMSFPLFPFWPTPIRDLLV